MEATRRASDRQQAPMALSRRYLLLTAAATAIAAAATWQRVLEMTPAQRRQLVESAFGGDGEGEEGGGPGFRVDGKAQLAFDEDAAPVMFAIRVFFAELSSSRLSAMIAVHFLLVMMYHVFLTLGRVCFGEIRLQELQQTKETMIHFVLMRCLLLASTMGPSLDGRSTLGPLFVWLSCLTLLRGLLTLCKARFHHLLTRPMTSIRDLRGLSGVLGLILALNLGLACVCSVFGMFADKISNVPWFEASLLLIKTMQLGAKVGFHMLDIGNTSVSLSEDEDSSSGEGYSENGELYLLLFQTALSGFYLVLLVLYYLYIISVDQFRVSLFDLILIINVKNATVLLLEKVKQVKFYHKLMVDMDELFPDATQDELEAVADDVCVICLKPMPTQAKKLRCGHLFHRFCLRQCLQKASIGDSLTGLDTLTRMTNGMALDPPTTTSPNTMNMTTLRCPLCRKHVYSSKNDPPSTSSLSSDDDAAARPPAPPLDDPVGIMQGEETTLQQPQEDQAAQAGERPRRDQAEEQSRREEVLRFSTEFLSRWIPFPNFSFEIVRNPHNGRGNGGGNRFNATPEMIQQIWEVFPQYSFDEIRADLQRTRSPERTMDRILNGRLDQQRQQLEGEPGGIPGEPLGGLAEAIDDLEHDIRWSVSTLWSSMWAPRPRPAHNGTAEAAAPSPHNDAVGIRGSGDEDWRQ